MSNIFGQLFRVSCFGESHGPALGVVIDGCPPGHKISLDKVQHWLDRRRPGQSQLTSPRGEKDRVICLSGLQQGVTLGTPLTLVVHNQDMSKGHYRDLEQVFRPSHADYTTLAKYGVAAASGGGRASARETIGRVAAAAIAEQLLASLLPGMRVVAYVHSVKDITARIAHPERLTRGGVEKTAMRCPDAKARAAMEQLILATKEAGDSVGGVIFCGITGVPAGLGEPVFDKLEADLARAMMSLPASKGFEIGMGFASTLLYGSQHNDPFYMDKGKVRTRSNRSGGIQGGISNGEFIYMRVAFKPVATIFKPQETVTRTGRKVIMQPAAGRHDPCVLPRAVPIVEAMALLVIMDHLLRQQALVAGAKPGRTVL